VVGLGLHQVILVPQPQQALRTSCGLAENPDETAITSHHSEPDSTSNISHGKRHH
jgi:hypothetical protein